MRIKIGIVGCGDIAQVHHVPWLTELAEEYEIVGVCDVSESAAKYLADWYKIPNYYTNHEDLLNSDVDAVLLCHTDPKTSIAVDAIRAGKHVFIEKPICLTVDDVDLMIEEKNKAGVVVQTGYMKLFEPAYEFARSEAEVMDDISLIEIRHMHPDNKLHVDQFRTRKFGDISQELRDSTTKIRNDDITRAIGDSAGLEARTAYMTLCGSLIHDMYGLRNIMGTPSKVLNTEIWKRSDGTSKGINFILEYPSGAKATATHMDLPDLWDFDETLKIYGDTKRITVSYATGFSKNQSSALVQEIDSNGNHQRREPLLDWESPFRRELRHFHAAVNGETETRAPLEQARKDVSLNVDIIKSYLANSDINIT